VITKEYDIKDEYQQHDNNFCNRAVRFEYNVVLSLQF